jgi:hypothetical protein
LQIQKKIVLPLRHYFYHSLLIFTKKNRLNMRKNLLLVAAGALMLAATTACDKPDNGGTGIGGGGGGGGATYCFTCVSTGTYTGTGATGKPTTTTQEVCNLTEEGARSVERSGTSTTTGESITFTMVTTCTRK